jgi:hypothetical protein
MTTGTLRHGKPGYRFTIGDLDPRDKQDPAGFEPAIASFGVAQDDEGRGFFRVHLPMQGSIRMEEVEFGGKNFGPNIIDNMDVKFFQADLIPFKVD